MRDTVKDYKNTMTEIYGANYAGFIRRTLKITKTKPDTFTLNGNIYEVSHDPAHQREQLEGYCGNNPK